jgi:xanthine dehydrogenase accessory factor
MSNVDHDKVLETASAWLDQGHRVALATVIKTWGSAPRPTGSQLVVRGDGEFAGSVSGGCVESAVITEALDAIKDGRMRKLSFGVSNDEAWTVGLACGGQIEIFVEPVT